MDQAFIATLTQWLHTAPGRYMRAWEHKQVNGMVANTFGYHAIQIGMPYWDLLRSNRMPHKVCTVDDSATDIKRSGLVMCRAEALPFDTESVDLLVLPHVLECSADPHQVLREVDRVLRPEGQAVFTGFNPNSLWGLHDRVPGLDTLLPIEPSRHLSLNRLCDWLELLSFDVEVANQGCYVPALRQARWLRRWAFLDVAANKAWPLPGAVYAVSAVKRVNSITLVGLDWSKNEKHVRHGGVVTAGRSAKVSEKQ